MTPSINSSESEQRRGSTDSSDELDVGDALTLEPKGNQNADESLQHAGEAVAARHSGIHTASIDASLYDAHTAINDLVKPPHDFERLAHSATRSWSG